MRPSPALAAGIALLALAPAGAPALADPLATPAWEDVRAEFFGAESLIFDDSSVALTMPAEVENGFDVPLVLSRFYHAESWMCGRE